MSVVVVDWLGRGGIAQTAEVWASTVCRYGVPVELVSRPGREIAVDRPGKLTRGPRGVQHAGVVAAAVRAIRLRRPRLVVIHSWLLPVSELPVYFAARAVGAELVVVAHNHESHTRSTGLDIGLSKALGMADRVICHSDFVANSIRLPNTTSLSVIPHPKPEGLLRFDMGVGAATDRPTCLQFGVQRGTKDVTLIAALADERYDRWSFIAAGTLANALKPSKGLDVRTGFQSAESLVAIVRQSDAVLLPYERASQSGAVVLARCLGAVPIASAVGGIPEQIDDGEDGILVSPGAAQGEWVAALDKAANPTFRNRCVEQGLKRMDLEHERFARFVEELALGTAGRHGGRRADRGSTYGHIDSENLGRHVGG